MSAPHFVRFCRALALLSGASALPVVAVSVSGCSSSDGTSQQVGDALPYDGRPVGVAPCDACGVLADTPDSDADADDGDAVVYDGHPIGVTPYDGGSDAGAGGGPQSLPDLPFLG